MPDLRKYTAVNFCPAAFFYSIYGVKVNTFFKMRLGIEFILASLQKTCKMPRQSRRCGEMADATDLKSVGL